MRPDLGWPVHCSDGPFGRLADVVIDPTRRRLTHLVVEPHHRHRLARLVPAELAGADDASPAIAVRCTAAELRRLPAVEEFAYLLPIGAVARVATDSIALALTKDEVGRLPAVPVHRWTARLAASDASERAKGTLPAA